VINFTPIPLEIIPDVGEPKPAKTKELSGRRWLGRRLATRRPVHGSHRASPLCGSPYWDIRLIDDNQLDKSPLSVAIFGCYPTSTPCRCSCLCWSNVADLLYFSSLRRGRSIRRFTFSITPTASTRRRRSSAAFFTRLHRFCFADFSFGYFVGFIFTTVIGQAISAKCFFRIRLQSLLGRPVRATSAIGFYYCTFHSRPLRRGLDHLPCDFEPLGELYPLARRRNLAVGANYNFRWVGVGDIYSFRTR